MLTSHQQLASISISNVNDPLTKQPRSAGTSIISLGRVALQLRDMQGKQVLQPCHSLPTCIYFQADHGVFYHRLGLL